VSSLRLDLPVSLDDVVSTALAKSEDARYASAAHMADDLEDVLAGRATRHAAGAASPSAGRGPAPEVTSAGPAPAASGSRGLAANDPLASLLDESPAPEAVPLHPGSATVPVEHAMAGASAPVTPRARRRWLVPAGALVASAAVAGGAFVSWGRPPALETLSSPSAPVASEGPPAAAETAPVPPDPSAPPATDPTPPPSPDPSPEPAVPSAPPMTVAAAATPAAPVPRPSEAPASPLVESPPSEPGEGAAPAPLHGGVQSRIRMSLEHPFENGRLIVWIDGVLVHEAKLQATGSKRIVAFKVREGRAETLLDVVPGPHEVRVEVTWEQGRRESRKVIDVAPGATGLLEVRVGRMSKDLSLSWSRLAKD
jgi:hypothetical protein